jgi:hypothetical protein
MDRSLSVQVDRGHWIDRTRFEQAGKEVDRGSVKDALKTTEESAEAARKAQVLELGTDITRTAAIVLLAWGISQRVGNSDVDKSTSTKLLIGGGASLGLSVGLAFGADGLYVKAVVQYNAQIHSFDD